MFYVIGGVWADTKFDQLDEDTMEFHGPFLDMKEAIDTWRGRAQLNVDNCNHRVFVATPKFDMDMKPTFKLGDNYELEFDNQLA